MNTSIWEIIASTPWWVALIFVYVMRIGLLATKPRVVSIKQLVILPVLLISLSLISLYNLINLSQLHIALWLGMLVLGSMLGWLQFKSLQIKALKNAAKLYVPGTWVLMVIILVIFCVRYYFGYQFATHPDMLTQPSTMNSIVCISGLVSGLFIGRLCYALRCLRVGPYTNDSH